MKISILIVVQPNFLSKRLGDEENIGIWKVIAVVEENPFESVECAGRVDVKSSFIDYFVKFYHLLSITSSLAFGRAVYYFKVKECLVVLIDLILNFEEAGSIEDYLLLAKGHEKPD